MNPRKKLAGLDQISLDCMIYACHEAGIRCNKANMQARAGLQIAIREALRSILPPDDPRRDPNYPFNQD